jgi:MFS family permease
MSENLVTPEGTTVANASPWAPLRYPTFRMLWLVWLASNTCMWMNDVAAAWLMTTLTSSPTLIALVQTASSLPVFLLGLPSGALADILDRRRYFMVTQFWVAANAAVLCAVAIAGHLTAPILLLLVFTNGIGLAMRWPVYAAILPEVIDRAHLGEALALNAVAVNTSRVAGPLLAGAVIASAGTEYVFALNFVISVVAAFVVSRWRARLRAFGAAGRALHRRTMRMGYGSIARIERMKDALVRATRSSSSTAAALFALMPLVAQRFGGDGAATYTVFCCRASAWARSRPAHAAAEERWCAMDARPLALARAPSAEGAVHRGSRLRDPRAIAGVAMVIAGRRVDRGGQFRDLPFRRSWRCRLPDPGAGMAIYQMSVMGGTALGAFVWGKLTSPAFPRALPPAA